MTTTGSTEAPGGERPRPRVVVGIDGSHGSRVALRAALLEAAARGGEVEAFAVYPVVYAWTAGRPIDVPDISAVRAGTRDRSRALVAEVRDEMAVEGVPAFADVPVRVVIEGGPPARLLVERAAGADLLVVGSRGHSAVRSLLLGSVALHCVTHAPCPVVVAHGRPGDPQRPGRHVAVGLDGSEAGLAALREAVGQALRRRTDLDVLVAYSVTEYWIDLNAFTGPSPEELEARVREETQRLVARVTAELAASGEALPGVHIHLVEGPAREVLVDSTRDAAMLVVGSHGRGAFRGLVLGSVALHCAMHAHCPVTVVHPGDRPAPAARSAQPASARA
jgi:nucleotide-binding universal stress UspA family protein